MRTIVVFLWYRQVVKHFTSQGIATHKENFEHVPLETICNGEVFLQTNFFVDYNCLKSEFIYHVHPICIYSVKMKKVKKRLKFFVPSLSSVHKI